MNGREALKALAEGKQVRRYDKRGDLWSDIGEYAVDNVLLYDNWEVYEPPATDEELIAEMEQVGRMFAPESAATEVAQKCARMLRERKVRP